MAMKIAILEDNRERQQAMRDCLSERFFQYELKFFNAAAPMIDFLKQQWDNTIAIALDHDLELRPTPTGHAADPGTGRQIVDFLVHWPPRCPVIIHTSNGSAAVGMEMALREARWPTYRVAPFGDLEWIRTLWFRTLRDAIVSDVGRHTPKPAPSDAAAAEGLQP